MLKQQTLMSVSFSSACAFANSFFCNCNSYSEFSNCLCNLFCSAIASCNLIQKIILTKSLFIMLS